MNVKYTINSKYEKKYKNFVLNIKDYFNNAEKTIHKARNEIKIISFEEKQFVVKSFKKPSLIKSIYYAKIVQKLSEVMNTV
jgi:hypothetical protein